MDIVETQLCYLTISYTLYCPTRLSEKPWHDETNKISAHIKN